MKNSDFYSLNARGYKIIPISVRKALISGYATREEIEAIDTSKNYFFKLDEETKRAFCIYYPKKIKTTTYKAITLYKELNRETVEEKPLGVDYILDIFFTSGKTKSLTFTSLEETKKALKLEELKGELTYTITRKERTITRLENTKPIEDIRLNTIEDTHAEAIFKQLKESEDLRG